MLHKSIHRIRYDEIVSGIAARCGYVQSTAYTTYLKISNVGTMDLLAFRANSMVFFIGIASVFFSSLSISIFCPEVYSDS